MTNQSRRRLPDYIRPDLQCLFVGINPGVRSSEVGHHFAGFSNRFWKLLCESNLVPVSLTYQEDWRLPEWGFGITNVVARPTPGINTLTPREYADGRRRLLKTIRRYQPPVVVLLGMTLYSALFPDSMICPDRSKKPTSRISPGLQTERLAGAQVFLLPNPSGRNAHYSYGNMLRAFRSLRALLKTQGQQGSSDRETLKGSDSPVARKQDKTAAHRNHRGRSFPHTPKAV